MRLNQIFSSQRSVGIHGTALKALFSITAVEIFHPARRTTRISIVILLEEATLLFLCFLLSVFPPFRLSTLVFHASTSAAFWPVELTARNISSLEKFLKCSAVSNAVSSSRSEIKTR